MQIPRLPGDMGGLGVGSRRSPGSQGVCGLGALRDCAELSPWDLGGTMSAPSFPSILGSPESPCKTDTSVVQMGPGYILSWCRMRHVTHMTPGFTDKQNARVTGS